MKSSQHPAAVIARGHLLRGQGEDEVIPPHAVDVDRRAPHPLRPQMQLLDHAQARDVLGPNADLHPVQATAEHQVVSDERDRGGGRAVAE